MIKNKNIRGSSKGLGRFLATFDKPLEREPVGRLTLLDSRLFGSTCIEVRQLVKSLCLK
jgi:hypothetical protein